MASAELNNKPIVMVTGSAGFIGSATVWSLLRSGYRVIGIDNHNNYYDQELKNDRVKISMLDSSYTHLKHDITDKPQLYEAFAKYRPNVVINLAAQVGVRYSVINPDEYIQSNLVGFANILDCSHKCNVNHLIYASSSSIYGGNTNLPYSTRYSANHPLSLYAATKKANELMAHSYSHLHRLPTTGLRFFTVYGPWGRPDMALFKFASQILKNEPIQIYNNGQHMRDFTFIDDVVSGIVACISSVAEPNMSWDGAKPAADSSFAPWKIYNIGKGTPVKLMDYIEALERALGVIAKKEYLPMQDGDMQETFSDITSTNQDFKYQPITSIDEGVMHFVNWFKSYYKAQSMLFK